MPPEARPENQPWPTYPMIYRVSSAHEEGGDRVYAVNTTEFLGDDDGNVANLQRALRLVGQLDRAGAIQNMPALTQIFEIREIDLDAHRAFLGLG